MAARRPAIEQALSRIAPGMPRFDAQVVADHAVDSPGLKSASPEAAAWLSLVAHIRHVHTDYDDLLVEGYDADSARFFVVDDINRTLAEWGCRKTVDPEAAGPDG